MKRSSTRLDQIAEIQTGPFGSQLHKKDYVDNGTPIITVEHLGGYRIKRQNLPRVSAEDASRLQKYSLSPGDIVFSRVGSVDQSTFVSDAESGWLFSGRCLRVRVDTNKADPLFIYYALNTNSTKSYIRAIAVGATMPSINTAILSEVPIAMPSVGEQRGIVAVLGSLDDKIAANSHAVEKALKLQSAVWEINTKDVGIIPLAEVAEPILGGTPSRRDYASWGGRYKWASVADMTASPRSHLLDTAETISAKAVEKKRFAPLPAGSVLLSARGTVGRVVSLVEQTSFNQSAYGFKAIPGFEAALRLAITSAVDELRAKSYGSVFSTITKAQINEATVPAVFDDPNQPLHQALNALEDVIVAVERENLSLAKTRDELLPLLMNGKITVREAEQEAVAAGAEVLGEENEA